MATNLEGKFFQNSRTGEVRQYDGIDNNDRVMLQDKNGQVITITESTVKRWWKQVDKGFTDAVVETNNNDVEVPATVTEDTIEKPVKVKKERKPRTNANGVDFQAIVNVIRDYAESVSLGIKTPNVKNWEVVTANGKYVIAYGFNSNGVTIWARSKTLPETIKDYATTNHMFDARIKITEVTEDTTQLIATVIDHGFQYLVAKQNKK